MLHGAGQVVAHRAVRYAQALGDFGIGQLFQLRQQKRLPHLGGQGAQQGVYLQQGLLGLGLCAWAQETENTSARYQSTYNWQQHPGFASSGSTSAFSLRAPREKMYTFSLTGHWGLRLESGAEVYANVELASGVPFTGNLVGMGSYTNGEITRAGGSTVSGRTTRTTGPRCCRPARSRGP